MSQIYNNRLLTLISNENNNIIKQDVNPDGNNIITSVIVVSLMIIMVNNTHFTNYANENWGKFVSIDKLVDYFLTNANDKSNTKSKFGNVFRFIQQILNIQFECGFVFWDSIENLELRKIITPSRWEPRTVASTVFHVQQKF